MGRKSGREMRALMLAVSASVLVLVLAIIAYFMVDVIITTNRNIERNKQLVIDQSELALAEIASNISAMSENPRLISLFNEEMLADILSGDLGAFNAFIGDFTISFYPIAYVGVIRDGEVVYHQTARGVDVEEAEMATSLPAGDYETLDTLGGREGFYISAFYPVELSKMGLGDFHVNMIVDRTDELVEVEEYFKGQRDDLILRLSIASVVAIILSLLLTTFALRYFTRKYVVDPIEELNRTAEEIADGTYAGEVQVDEGSAYAALQGLLRSGQKVLSRMDEHIKD